MWLKTHNGSKAFWHFSFHIKKNILPIYLKKRTVVKKYQISSISNRNHRFCYFTMSSFESSMCDKTLKVTAHHIHVWVGCNRQWTAINFFRVYVFSLIFVFICLKDGNAWKWNAVHSGKPARTVCKLSSVQQLSTSSFTHLLPGDEWQYTLHQLVYVQKHWQLISLHIF